MQANEQIPMPGIPDRVMGYVLQALFYDAKPKRFVRAADSLTEAAERLEGTALRRAGVYSIRDGGVMYGERPQDRDSLEVARILREYAAWARTMGS